MKNDRLRIIYAGAELEVENGCRVVVESGRLTFGKSKKPWCIPCGQVTITCNENYHLCD